MATKALFQLAAVVLSVCVTSVHAADLVLVAKDTAPAPIIVFKDAPPRTRNAAVTVAEYLQKISGQKKISVT